MYRLDAITSFFREAHEENYQTMKDMLRSGLFSIEPTLASLTKAHLALLSTPGVADVCNQIKQDPSQIDSLTIRGRSVALISRGRMLNAGGTSFLPVMDWFVAQIKFYSNIDCYPFVIRPDCSLAPVLSDLSNTYAGALILDNEDIPEVSNNNLRFFTLSHWKVCSLLESEVTNAEFSAYLLAYLIHIRYNGNLQQKDILKFASIGPCRLHDKQIDLASFDEQRIATTSPIKMHQSLAGKIGISLKFQDLEKLKNYFTYPNLTKLVSENSKQPCVTAKLNVILTDGTSVLGLGNIGPIPGLPVMQAKSMMFKLLGDVNVVPVCINPRETPQLAVEAILDLVHLYKAVNLQDFKAPQCFTIERSLQDTKQLFIFHDDQHGTSIAALAGLINALRLCDKDHTRCRIVIAGAGAAGINIAKIMHNYGVQDIIVCDTQGTIFKGRHQNMNPFKIEIAELTNKSMIRGSLQDAIDNADVFIGVSTRDTFKKQWIKKMKPKPIIFALANPVPEISQQEAVEGGCYIYASGKNNRPNQISNSLVYPGIFKAINELDILKIMPQMEIAVAQEIALLKGEDASQWQILPACLNKHISTRISQKLREFV